MIAIKKVQASDLDTLINLSRKTFYDAFFHLNDPADVNAYASAAFSSERMLSEVSNPDSAFYFAVINNEAIGYIKLNYAPAQTEFKDDKAVEVERIYVLAGNQGQQIGRHLLDFAIQQAINAKLEYIWLGVWDKNNHAIRFYQRAGFEVIGSHNFMLGNDRQVDLLMKKTLLNT